MAKNHPWTELFEWFSELDEELDQNDMYEKMKQIQKWILSI